MLALEDRRFYVYLHRRLTDNTPFYVGKGCGERAFKSTQRNFVWNRIVKSHSFTAEIVNSNLTEKEALEKEKNVITELITAGYKLANLTKGHDGGMSFKRKPLSKATKEKMSLSHKNLRHTDEVLQKMRDTWTEEKRQAFAENRTGTKATKFDTTVYSFIRNDQLEFTGTRVELCEKFNLKPSLIKSLFGKRKRKSAENWKLQNGYYS